MSRSIKETVREKYGRAARLAGEKGEACCGPACCGPDSAKQAAVEEADPITSDLYGEDETAGLPETAVGASLGCGNPTALAELRPGEVVLDLGSGGGLDVLLSARRVGPEGRAYGVDMTPEMLQLARENQARAGIENAEFLEGEMEDVPLPDESVDVVISNCVINLSGDKARVLAEAFRVLKPGGRLAVSDIVVRGPLSDEVRRSAELWAGCVAGALDQDEFRDLLVEAGFHEVSIEPTRVFGLEEAAGILAEAGLDAKREGPGLAGRLASAFVRGKKPGAPPAAIA